MAQGDLYRLIDRQRHATDEAINVYFYQQFTSAGNIEDLGAAWEADVLAEVLPVQHTTMQHDSWSILNITDGIEFAEHTYPSPKFGSSPGAAMADFIAWSFLLRRGSLLTRHGGKRIGGLSENDLLGDVPDPGAIARLNNLALAFAERIETAPLGAEWEPVIVKRPILIPGINIFSVVSSAEFRHVSTQNTRKNF